MNNNNNNNNVVIFIVIAVAFLFLVNELRNYRYIIVDNCIRTE